MTLEQLPQVFADGILVPKTICSSSPCQGTQPLGTFICLWPPHFLIWTLGSSLQIGFLAWLYLIPILTLKPTAAFHTSPCDFISWEYFCLLAQLLFGNGSVQQQSQNIWLLNIVLPAPPPKKPMCCLALIYSSGKMRNNPNLCFLT